MTDDDAVTPTPEADSAEPAVAAPARVVTAVKQFAARHGGATAVLQDLGNEGVRITLVGNEDGVLGDQVVANEAIATAVAAAAGVEVGEWERELVSKATPRDGHYRQMAGYRAGRR